MVQILQQIPYPVLIVLAVGMGLAPFYPMPHLLEKLLLLKNGQLTKPIDIFDLFFHLTPALVLLVKWLTDRP